MNLPAAQPPAPSRTGAGPTWAVAFAGFCGFLGLYATQPLLLVDANGAREIPRNDKLALARLLVADIAKRLVKQSD